MADVPKDSSSSVLLGEGRENAGGEFSLVRWATRSAGDTPPAIVSGFRKEVEAGEDGGTTYFPEDVSRKGAIPLFLALRGDRLPTTTLRTGTAARLGG